MFVPSPDTCLCLTDFVCHSSYICLGDTNIMEYKNAPSFIMLIPASYNNDS